jgi:phosphohistidine phosphatase SixA
VIVLLVRHARAGDREQWEGDDRLRPLDGKGRRQAEGLDALLAGYAIERLLSSPYLRCMQTFEPLAEARGLEIEEAPELAEGSTRADVLRLLAPLGEQVVALSTHGDVVEELMEEGLKKGAVEVLELEDGRLRRVRHLGRPPA